jgi:cobaltochelatase CobN
LKIICIDCTFNYRLWQTSVITIADGKQIAPAVLPDETIVLYQMNAMEFPFSEYLNEIKSVATLIPIGGEAASLGLSNAEPEHITMVNQYVLYGGDKNIRSLEQYLALSVLGDTSFAAPELPKETAFDGIFRFDSEEVYPSLSAYLDDVQPKFETFAAVFIHRHAWVNRNLAALKAICEELEKNGIGAVPVFSSSDGNSPDFAGIADRYFSISGKVFIQALVSLNLFAIMAKDGRSVSEQSTKEYERLGVPVFAPVHSYNINESDWKDANNPLTEDMATALILPEMVGMIEPILVSVTGEDNVDIPLLDRAALAARRIASWIKLRTTENKDKKIALMLHNSVCSGVEATVGRAFGLDALESTVKMLRRLAAEGYNVTDIPESGEALLDLIMSKKAFSDFRWTSVEDIVGSGGSLYQMSVKSEYEAYYLDLPETSREYMEQVWGVPPGEGMTLNGDLIITGLSFGNAVVMVQPKRGCYGAKCTGEVCKILHDPTCPPPHQYLATYRYLRDVFKANAVIDIGTDGSTEYLPGKVSGLSSECWPSIILDSLPSLYLYNAGVISEGMIVKRRMNSVILDYLPPASMGVDEKSAELSRLIDEYQNAIALDSGQASLLESRMESLIKENPAVERIAGDDYKSVLLDIQEVIRKADKAKQINIEHHVFGQIPSEEEMNRYIREIWSSEGLDDSNPLFGSDFDEIKDGLLNTRLEMDNLVRSLNGGYIPAGESGMPDENGRNIIPTGRNMFGLQIDKVPTMSAWERGKDLANQLLDQYLKDEGHLPEQIAINMISLDVTRAGGEQLSQFLYLLGVRPVWDKQGRVNGLDVIPLSELNRPRIDVTVRISGVLRDTWPSVVMMMDDAVLIVSNLEEDEAMNFVLKHIHEYASEFNVNLDESRRAIRIFGDPPGAYGAGLDLALLASAWKDEDDLLKYFTQSSAFAYGKGLDGARKVREFVDIARKVEVSSDITQSRRVNAMSCGFGVQVQGGYRLLAKRLSGRAIRQYQAVSETGSAPVTESLDENLKHIVEDTVLNEFWRESVKNRGYDGAADIMHSLQNVFSAQVVIDCFSDDFIDKIAEETINNDELREWLDKTNPYASEEIGRRLLELQSRGRWNPSEDVFERLKQNYLLIEGDMEGRLEPLGEIQGGSLEIINHEGNELWEAQLSDIQSELSKDFSK